MNNFPKDSKKDLDPSKIEESIGTEEEYSTFLPEKESELVYSSDLDHENSIQTSEMEREEYQENLDKDDHLKISDEELFDNPFGDESSGLIETIDEANGDNKFKEGLPITFIKVRFPGNPKALAYYIGNKRFAYHQRVIAMSDRGMAIGYISSFPYNIKFHKSMLPLKTIVKVASDKDLRKDMLIQEKAREAKYVCEKHINSLKLDMELTHVEYTQFGKKAVFYFTAPGRVDFRELVKGLVSNLKMRIELRQIYLRDRPAAIGGLGPCGRQLCCNSFLERYGHVNIKMAKNQNLTLSSSKLNGVCGQLKCCIQYEDEVYSDKKSRLPDIGQFIKCLNGDIGLVERLHILTEHFELLTDKGKRKKYLATLFDSKNYSQNCGDHLKFPLHFEFIADETMTTIDSY